MSLPSVQPAASDASRKLSRSPSSKSLTPQRKHRKLLKDGSGSEVWPESIEKIFVEGLRQYWESPWATYSRGRSRWRNQFLVDYLHKAGIERSKKQVASHIQVLRNMWKGEPEFHLVAGGEELFLETGLLAPVKLEEQCDEDRLIKLDVDEHDSRLSNSPPGGMYMTKLERSDSPARLSPMFPSDSYTSARLVSFPHEVPGAGSSTPHAFFSLSRFETSFVSPAELHSATSTPTDTPETMLSSLDFTPPFLLTELEMDSSVTMAPLPSIGQPYTSDYLSEISLADLSTNMSTASFGNPLLSSQAVSMSQLFSISIWADGMTPYTVQVDATSSSQSTRSFVPPILRFKVTIPSVNDLHSPPTLHGCSAKVVLSPWPSGTHAKCLTKVYEQNMCMSEESAPLPVAASDLIGWPVTVYLPDSVLSSCRWLNASVQTSITQELIVDSAVVAYIIYDLDRRTAAGGLPTIELIGYQNCGAMSKGPRPTANILQQPSYTYSSPNPPSSNPHCFPLTNSTSLSCALTPVNKPSAARTSSALF